MMLHPTWFVALFTGRRSKEERRRTTQAVIDNISGKVRLREPRPLYGFSTAQIGNQQLPRW